MIVVLFICNSDFQVSGAASSLLVCIWFGVFVDSEVGRVVLPSARNLSRAVAVFLLSFLLPSFAC
jgi:hypothetical protein